MKSYKSILSCLLAPLCAAQAPLSWAQSYPARPVRLLVPSTPGGSVDTLARAVSPKLSEKWGQQLVIDNRAGAGGVLAAETVAKAPPDGYTLLLGTVSALATNVSLQKKLPYDPVRDFAPVSLLATQPLMLVVNASLPAKSVDELTALARSKPGELTHSSAGNGTGSHLSAELFKSLAKIDLVHVPYKGIAPALLDVVSGRVSMTFPSTLSALPHVRSGKVRALAVTGLKRSPAAPDIPTMNEAGVKGYESSTWYGVVAPAATPGAVVNKLSGDLAYALRLDDLRERMSHEGLELVGSTPAQFRQFMVNEIEKWGRLIKSRGIQAG
jgi:tripartite-type tricarboxylate transporter receptor subunit TctC